MDELEQKILQSAQGEQRLKPDEQRNYLGTFAERVVLSILLEDAGKQPILSHFDNIMSDMVDRYGLVAVKISDKLTVAVQMAYMKKAQAAGLTATIINEEGSQSPFGLIMHTDKAENASHTDIKELYPQFFKERTQAEKTGKKSFWQRLFRKEN
ncbi:DUF1694 domain-containing protein [Streptococcus pantholopis]|uniref:Glycogen synthase n=1 Tax=Streptococcus pantholopis TaxID=1811193 RepID=A0A172Q6K6_9STRE|nr:DUF1694 domain-containing protein [Streptococcus pantholopis]AND79096.1 glycogen synthase [Streptococcus pantholopis]